MPKRRVLCTRCLEQAIPKTVTPGSIGVEILAWIFFLIPGLMYSLWRLSARELACPSCGATELVPLQSPAAKRLLKRAEPAAPEPPELRVADPTPLPTDDSIRTDPDGIKVYEID
jgi:hypothetical protein